MNLTRLTRVSRLTHLRSLTHLSNFFEGVATDSEKGLTEVNEEN